MAGLDTPDDARPDRRSSHTSDRPALPPEPALGGDHGDQHVPDEVHDHDVMREAGPVIGAVLRIGVALSSVLIAVGFGWWAIDGAFDGGREGLDRHLDGEVPFPTSLGAVVRALADGRPEALIVVGLVVLVATPIVRVAAAGLVFLRQGDRTYAVIAVVVLVLLAGSFAVELAN